MIEFTCQINQKQRNHISVSRSEWMQSVWFMNSQLKISNRSSGYILCCSSFHSLYEILLTERYGAFTDRMDRRSKICNWFNQFLSLKYFFYIFFIFIYFYIFSCSIKLVLLRKSRLTQDIVIYVLITFAVIVHICILKERDFLFFPSLLEVNYKKYKMI